MFLSSSESLVFLTSHSGTEDDLPISIGPTPRRIYSLIQVSVLAGTLKVENVMSVPYQSVCHRIAIFSTKAHCDYRRSALLKPRCSHNYN